MHEGNASGSRSLKQQPMGESSQVHQLRGDYYSRNTVLPIGYDSTIKTSSHLQGSGQQNSC